MPTDDSELRTALGAAWGEITSPGPVVWVKQESYRAPKPRPVDQDDTQGDR